MSKVDKMYDAIQELVCAFVVNQEAVEKAKTQKKSMLKTYQDRDKDLESAFKDCLEVCESIKEENNNTDSLSAFLKDTARMYGSEASLHIQEIEELVKRRELAGVRDKKRIDKCIEEHNKSVRYYNSKMSQALLFANQV